MLEMYKKLSAICPIIYLIYEQGKYSFIPTKRASENQIKEANKLIEGK